ncbi:MAG: hypothetical protein IPJ65_26700 [Archangiaceae bacterium]|nr:hypothetical protein [Archangiaceae bacterium]
MRWLLPVVLLAVGCNAPVVECSDAGTTLTYAEFGQPFMAKYCVSCHGSTLAEKGVRLDTVSGIERSKGEVVDQAGTGAQMPPSESLIPTTAERAQLADWLSCGGP